MADELKKIEILSKRGERCKHFDLGNGLRQFVGHTAPIHFKNAQNDWEDIVLDFQDDGLGNLLIDKNKVSCGFRKDLKLEKYFGLRYDYEHQFEATINKIKLDGIEQIIGSEFSLAAEVKTKQAISNKLNSNVEIINRLNEVSLRNYFKITNPVEDFEITEELHLKGLSCSNKKDGEYYIPDKQGIFNFVDEKGDWKFGIRQPFFVDSNGKFYPTVKHELKEVAGRLFYTKTPTAEGKDDLVMAKFPIEVDADTFYTTTADGYVQTTNGVWATIHEQTTGASVNNTNTVHHVSINPYKTDWNLSRAFLYFDTSSIGSGQVVTDAVLSLYQTNTYAAMSVQKGTQAGTLTVDDIHSFSGDEYAHITPTIEQYNDWVFNAQGESDIEMEGTTKICVRNYVYDYLFPDTPASAQSTFYSAEETETGERRPRLVVTYEAAGGVVIQKSLKYCVVKEHAAITKSLKYTVVKEHAAIEKGLIYKVKPSVKIQKGLIYKVLPSIAINKSLKYCVPTTPSAKTKSLQYNIFLGETKIEKSLGYSVLKATDITKGLIYKVITDTKIQKSLEYVVSLAETIEKTLKYTVKITPTEITKQLKYCVFLGETKIEKSLAYKAKPSVKIQKELKYTVETTPTEITKSLQYSVFLGSTKIEKSLQYVVATEAVKIQKSLRYDVFLGATAIQKGLIYKVVAEYYIPLSLKYTTKTPVKVEKTLTYAVEITPTAITKALSYNIFLGATQIQKSLQYAVRGAIAITKGLIYKVSPSTAINKSLKYCVPSTPAAKQKELKYAVVITPTALTKGLEYCVVSTPSAITKSLAYEVLSQTKIEKSLSYEVLSEQAITKDLKYAVVSAPTAIQKTLEYQVLITPAAITKSLHYEVVAEIAITKSLKYCIIKEASAITKSLEYSVGGDYPYERFGEYPYENGSPYSPFP